MNFLKSIRDNIDDDIKKKIFIFGGIVIVLIVIIIIISTIVSIINKKTPYETVEGIMEKSAYNYLSDNKELLPSENNNIISIDINTLVEQKYMKDLYKLTKNKTCTGQVLVKYMNNDYYYQGYLTCDNYKTELLVNKIRQDNQIVTSGDGLYEETDFYRFRGEYVNNYVQIGNINYRIFKIGKDNKIYIIPEDIDSNDDTTYLDWDDRYNSEEDSSCGINDYNLSRMKKSLDEVYNSLDDLIKENATTYSICAGKRSESNVDLSGLAECSNKIDDVKISLLPVYEYIKSSIAPACRSVVSRECKNYNYLIIDESSWWTLTADSSNTYKV